MDAVQYEQSALDESLNLNDHAIEELVKHKKGPSPQDHVGV